jgi:Bifunctional DNA primase/polymerase, N-terminal/AAA domain
MIAMTDSASSPYQQGFMGYINNGWKSVLPLPLGAKYPPPEGFTGREAPTPTYNHYVQWGAGAGNICLRLPDGVIGLDVDHYNTKTGWDTLRELERRLGTLPDTWRSTSREDGASGIRLYKTPTNMWWPASAGADIDIIQSSHRYTVVWPSQHPNGGTYHWITPDGISLIGAGPHIDDLPDLPNAWVKHLTKGRSASEDDIPTLNHSDIQNVLTRIATDGAMCQQVNTLFNELLDSIETNTQRHDTAVTVTLKLAALGAAGHEGVAEALNILEHNFVLAVGATRGKQTATLEWQRLLAGACAYVIDEPAETCLGDDCTRHLPSLDLTPPTELQPPTPEPEDDQDTPSWEPIDMHAVFIGEKQPSEPTLWHRSDGRALLYPGKVHSIYGESESGKSMLMQHETAEQLKKGNTVLYIDFESDEHTIIDRLRRLGVTVAHIHNLTYIRPERTWSNPIEQPVKEQILTSTYTLAIIDGVTEALNIFGAETNDNDTITRFMRTFPRRLARATGAAVVLIDHIPKNAKNSRHAIGGQAKLAAVDGAAYLITVDEVLGIDKFGQLRVKITKDRPGRIRGHCWTDESGHERIQTAAVVPVDSREKDITKMSVCPPDGSNHDAMALQRISNIIHNAPNQTIRKCDIRTTLGIGEGGPTTEFNKRVKKLVDGGFITEKESPGKSQMMQSIKPYVALQAKIG